MPADYMKCRDALVKEGKPMKEAQRICAIQYYKKHGKALPRDSKSNLSADEIPVDGEDHPMDHEDASLVLNWMYEELSAARKRKTTLTGKDMVTMMNKYTKNHKMTKENMMEGTEEIK